MHRILAVGNLSWSIETLYFIFSSSESWKNLSPEAIKLRNKGPRG